MPSTNSEKIALCIALKGFLTAQPDYAVTNPKITFTAARFAALELALTGANTDLNEEESETGSEKQHRADAALPVRKMIRLVIAILDYYLDDDSPLWDAFGLNRPGAISTPEQPELPAILAALPGQLRAKIPSVPGSTHQRWFLRPSGTTDFVFTERTSTVEVLLEGLAAGSYEIQVTANNVVGESIPSLPAMAVVL